MNDIDDLERALAFALSRSTWKSDLRTIEACRRAAADQVKHLQRAGFSVSRKPPQRGASHLAGG